MYIDLEQLRAALSVRDLTDPAQGAHAMQLRDLDRTLTASEANLLRDRIYAALHRGTAHEWAARA